MAIKYGNTDTPNVSVIKYGSNAEDVKVLKYGDSVAWSKPIVIASSVEYGSLEISRTKGDLSEPTSNSSDTSPTTAYFGDSLTVTMSPDSTIVGYTFTLNVHQAQYYQGDIAVGDAFTINSGEAFTIDNVESVYNKIVITVTYTQTIKQIPYYINKNDSRIPIVGVSTSSDTLSFDPSETSYGYFDTVYGYVKMESSVTAMPYHNGGWSLFAYYYKYESPPGGGSPRGYTYYRTCSGSSRPRYDYVFFGTYDTIHLPRTIYSGNIYVTNGVDKVLADRLDYSDLCFYGTSLSWPDAYRGTVTSKPGVPIQAATWNNEVIVPLYANNSFTGDYATLHFWSYWDTDWHKPAIKIRVDVPDGFMPTGSITLSTCSVNTYN